MSQGNQSSPSKTPKLELRLPCLSGLEDCYTYTVTVCSPNLMQTEGDFDF